MELPQCWIQGSRFPVDLGTRMVGAIVYLTVSKYCSCFLVVRYWWIFVDGFLTRCHLGHIGIVILIIDFGIPVRISAVVWVDVGWIAIID